MIAVAALVLLAFITIVMANLAGSTIRQKTAEKYQWDTEQISHRMQTTLNNYSNVLYGGRALLLNSQTVGPNEWTGYFRSQDIFNQYKGMSSISYISLVSPSQKAQFEAKMKNLYGANFAITPAGARDTYALASLVVSANNIGPWGFDVYSTPDRRAVYEQAKTSGQPTASGEFEFATGSRGLMTTLPVSRNGVTEGFVMIALRSDDFFEATIEPSKLSSFAIKVTDTTNSDTPEELYTSASWNEDSANLRKADVIKFGGRTWNVEYQAPINYNQSNIGIAMPYLIMSLGFLLVCVIALCFYIFLRMPARHDKVVIKRTVNETTTTTTTEE